MKTRCYNENMNLRNIKCILISVLLCFCLITFVRNGSTNDAEKDLFFVAQKAFDDGFYDIAIRYLDQFFQQYPDSDKAIQAKLLVGQCYFFQNQYLKAYETFQSLSAYPNFQDATLFWLGETYLKGSDYKQAEKNYKQLLELYPTSSYVPQALYSLGWVAFEQKNYKTAQDIFFKLIRSFPSHTLREDASFKAAECSYYLGEYSSATKYFQDYLEAFVHSPRQAQVHFYIGESYYYLNDYLTASTFYAKAAEISSDVKIILLSKISLGWCYVKLKRYELAQKTFAQARTLAEEKNALSDDIYLGQASLYSEMAEHSKAIEAYSQLISQFPSSSRLAEAYLGKANNLYILQDYQGALVEYRNIIDKFAQIPEREELVEKAYFGLAWTYLRAGQTELAIEYFKNIMNQTKSKVSQVSALVQLGDAYQDIANYERAIEIYDQILKEFPDSPYADYAQFRQGVALLKTEKIEAANLSFKTLEANFKDSKFLTDAQYFLGVAAYKQGDWTTAQQYMEKYLASPEGTGEFSAEANYILALSLFNRSEYKKSLAVSQQLIKDFPSNTSIVRNTEKNIAQSLYKLNQAEAAIAKYYDLIKQYPNSSVAEDALEWLGSYYFDSTDFPKAVEILQDFLQKFPDSEKVNAIHYQLAQTFENLGQWDNALDQYKSVTDFQDREFYPKAKLAIAEIFAKEMEPDTAIQTYENIISSSPDFKRDAYVKIASLYKSQQNYEKAILAYQNALQSDIGLSQVGNAELQFSLADSYELLNQKTKASEEYLKIPYLYSEEKSWSIKAYLRIARLYEDAQSWEDARLTYQKILAYRTDESKYAQERLEWIEKNISH